MGQVEDLPLELAPPARYRRWIDTCGGEEFVTVVEAVLHLTDRACENLSPPQKTTATEAFITASRYEWMFWNMGWTPEGWPI